MTARTLLALGCAGLLLCGCLPTGSIGHVGSDRNCLSDNARFADAWSCVRARLAARSGDPKRDGMLQEGDLLAEQVRTGKVSDAEAKRRLSAGLSQEVGE